MTIILALTLSMSLASCSCGAKNKQAPGGPLGQGQGQGLGVGPGAQGALGKLMPANIDEATKQKCAAICKDMCVRGKECKAPGFGKPARCAKACLVMCARGVVDQPVGDCVKNAADCPQVTQCLAELTTKIRNLKAAGGKPGAAPPTPAEAPAAAEPPAPPAAAPAGGE